jgi:hypothetical protein
VKHVIGVKIKGRGDWKTYVNGSSMTFRKREMEEEVSGDLVLEEALDLTSDYHVTMINCTCSACTYAFHRHVNRKPLKRKIQ